MRYYTLTAAVVSFFLLSAFKPQDVQSFTEGNIILGYVVPGACAGFTQDSRFLMTSTGVYEVSTGQPDLTFLGWPVLSPDQRYLWVGEDGTHEFTSALFSFETGERLLEFDEYGAAFSPDGKFIAVNTDGLYDLDTLTRTIRFSGDWHLYPPQFSPDSRYVVTRETDHRFNIYDVHGARQLFSITKTHDDDYSAQPVFSADNTLLAMNDVYDLATGQEVFSASRQILFSPDSTLAAIGGDGLYEIESGSRLIRFTGVPIFSPDGIYLIVRENAGGTYVYDIYNIRDGSGQRQFRTGFTDSALPVLSPDGHFLFLPDAIYELSTGNVQDTFWQEPEPNSLIFSPDGLFFVAGENGLYELDSQRRILDLTESIMGFYADSFTSDHSLLAAGINFVHADWDMDINMVCALLGSENYPWPYRKGIVTAKFNAKFPPYDSPGTAIAFYDSPDGQVVMEKNWVGKHSLIVYAMTPDQAWFKVAGNQWIRSSDVDILSLPETVPVE